MTDEEFIKQTVAPNDNSAMPKDVLDAMAECVRCKAIKDDLNRQKKANDSDLETAQGIVLAWLESSPIDKMSAHGGNFYLIRDVSFSSPSGTDATVDRIMKSAKPELLQLLGVNHMKFKSWLKHELEDEAGVWQVDETKVPEELRDVIKITEFFKLGMRKA
jgi:hypothetical protein